MPRKTNLRGIDSRFAPSCQGEPEGGRRKSNSEHARSHARSHAQKTHTKDPAYLRQHVTRSMPTRIGAVAQSRTTTPKKAVRGRRAHEFRPAPLRALHTVPSTTPEPFAPRRYGLDSTACFNANNKRQAAFSQPERAATTGSRRPQTHTTCTSTPHTRHTIKPCRTTQSSSSNH